MSGKRWFALHQPPFGFANCGSPQNVWLVDSKPRVYPSMHILIFFGRSQHFHSPNGPDSIIVQPFYYIHVVIYYREPFICYTDAKSNIKPSSGLHHVTVQASNTNSTKLRCKLEPMEELESNNVWSWKPWIFQSEREVACGSCLWKSPPWWPDKGGVWHPRPVSGKVKGSRCTKRAAGNLCSLPI